MCNYVCLPVLQGRGIVHTRLETLTYGQLCFGKPMVLGKCVPLGPTGRKVVPDYYLIHPRRDMCAIRSSYTKAVWVQIPDQHSAVGRDFAHEGESTVRNQRLQYGDLCIQSRPKPKYTSDTQGLSRAFVGYSTCPSNLSLHG
jgi:hypothetical protein